MSVAISLRYLAVTENSRSCCCLLSPLYLCCCCCCCPRYSDIAVPGVTTSTYRRICSARSVPGTGDMAFANNAPDEGSLVATAADGYCAMVDFRTGVRLWKDMQAFPDIFQRKSANSTASLGIGGRSAWFSNFVHFHLVSPHSRRNAACVSADTFIVMCCASANFTAVLVRKNNR